jgi:hypothetical protein
VASDRISNDRVATAQATGGTSLSTFSLGTSSLEYNGHAAAAAEVRGGTVGHRNDGATVREGKAGCAALPRSCRRHRPSQHTSLLVIFGCLAVCRPDGGRAHGGAQATAADGVRYRQRGAAYQEGRSGGGW